MRPSLPLYSGGLLCWNTGEVHTTQWEVNEHTKFLLTLVLWDLNGKQCVHCVPCLREAFTAPAPRGWDALRLHQNNPGDVPLPFPVPSSSPDTPITAIQHILYSPSALKVILSISVWGMESDFGQRSVQLLWFMEMLLQVGCWIFC